MMLVTGGVGIGIIIVLAVLSKSVKLPGMGGFILILLMLLIRAIMERQVNRTYKAARRAVRGAKAEEKVGELLDSLGDDYYVLHDVESPYGNIDHIVISRENGVFLIETKSHGGKVEILGDKVLVNEKPPEKGFVAQTLRNTCWFRDQIKQAAAIEIWVTPILLFTNAFVPLGRRVRGIHVINKKYLIDILQRESRGNALMNERMWEAREALTSILASPVGRSEAIIHE
jgi:hypothetical protein